MRALHRVTQLRVAEPSPEPLRSRWNPLALLARPSPGSASSRPQPVKVPRSSPTTVTLLPAGSQCILPGGSPLCRPCARQAGQLQPPSRGLAGRSPGPSCTSLEGAALSQLPTRGPKRLSPRPTHTGQDQGVCLMCLESGPCQARRLEAPQSRKRRHCLLYPLSKAEIKAEKGPGEISGVLSPECENTHVPTHSGTHPHARKHSFPHLAPSYVHS